MLGVTTIMWLAYRFIAAPSTMAPGQRSVSRRVPASRLTARRAVPAAAAARGAARHQSSFGGSAPEARVGHGHVRRVVAKRIRAMDEAYNATRVRFARPDLDRVAGRRSERQLPSHLPRRLLGYAAPPTMESSLICGPTTHVWNTPRDQSRLDRQQRQAAMDYVHDHPRPCHARLGDTARAHIRCVPTAPTGPTRRRPAHAALDPPRTRSSATGCSSHSPRTASCSVDGAKSRCTRCSCPSPSSRSRSRPRSVPCVTGHPPRSRCVILRARSRSRRWSGRRHARVVADPQANGDPTRDHARTDLADRRSQKRCRSGNLCG